MTTLTSDVVLLSILPVGCADGPAEKPLSPDEASKHVTEKVTLQMLVERRRTD